MSTGLRNIRAELFVVLVRRWSVRRDIGAHGKDVYAAWSVRWKMKQIRLQFPILRSFSFLVPRSTFGYLEHAQHHYPVEALSKTASFRTLRASQQSFPIREGNLRQESRFLVVWIYSHISSDCDDWEWKHLRRCPTGENRFWALGRVRYNAEDALYEAVQFFLNYNFLCWQRIIK